MDDPYDVLDCVLRSRYLAPADLPHTPFWHRLPIELQSALTDALASDASLKVVVPLVWKVRARLLGKPTGDYERTRATVRLRLGLLYLGYRKGRIAADELLSSAFHVADSYVCGVDAKPFVWLRHELQASGLGESAAPQIAALFAPYEALAAECVGHWGFESPLGEASSVVIQAEPFAPPDPAGT